MTGFLSTLRKWLAPKTVPDLIKGLPANFKEGSAELQRRARFTFPVGTPDSTVKEMLKGWRFEIEADEGDWRFATFYRRQFVFTTFWSIRWQSKGGKVARLVGIYGSRGP